MQYCIIFPTCIYRDYRANKRIALCVHDFHDSNHKILNVKKLQMHSANHENYIAVCYFLYARRYISRSSRNSGGVVVVAEEI